MGTRTRAIEQIEHDARAVELRRQHLSYRQIAVRLGVSHQAAFDAVKRGLADMYQEAANEVRQIEVERLDELATEAWKVLRTPHYTVSNSGKIVEHPETGELLLDTSPTLAAIDRLLKIQDRRAKLLGLDAPVKAEVKHVDSFDADIAALLADLASRSEGPPAGHPEVLQVAAEGEAGPTPTAG